MANVSRPACCWSAGPQGREDSQELPELAAAARRGDHLDTQAPARPGTPRRPGPRRTVGARPSAPARPQRYHLVQLADRRAGQALPGRLRSLSCPYFPVNDLGDQQAEVLGVLDRLAT